MEKIIFVDTIKNLFKKDKTRKILDDTLTDQLAGHLERLQPPIELAMSLDNSDMAREMRALLEEVAVLSEKINLRHDGDNVRKPSFSIARIGETPRIRFACIPLGHEFTSLVLALLHTGGYPPKVEPEVIEQIRALTGSYHFESFITMSCCNCPDGVQLLNMMAALNPGISHTVIDGNMFLPEIDQHKIKAVPTAHLNGHFFGQGRKTIVEYLAKISAENLAFETGEST